LPTVSRPNQVLNDEACSRFDDGATLWRFLASVLSAHPGQLGGTLPDDAFTAAQFDTLTQQTTAQALRHANATQVATTQAYQAEAARMADKHGAAHPTAQALQTLGQAGAQASRVMSAGAEAVSVEAPQADEGGSSFSGRFVNDRGQGLADHVVELVQAGGRRVEGIGRTDANGFFGAAFDAARTAALAKEGDLSARVLDLAGQELLLDKTALRFAPGAQLQVTLVVPVRAVPKPTVPPPPPPVPPPPPPPPSPPPAVRTSLAKLDIDDDTRKLLQQGGVPDVEALLEIDPAKLAKIVNSEETARKLIELARRLLGTPTPKPQKRTSPPKKAR
jgi:hypothetical protein